MKCYKNVVRVCAFLVLLCGLSTAAYALNVGQKVEDGIGTTKEFADGFVHLRIVDNHLQVYFLNKEQEVVAPTWPKGLALLDGVVNRDVDREPYPLESNGTCLTSPKFIQKPWNYFVTLTLIREKEGEDNETQFVGRFRVKQLDSQSAP